MKRREMIYKIAYRLKESEYFGPTASDITTANQILDLMEELGMVPPSRSSPITYQEILNSRNSAAEELAHSWDIE